MRRLENFETQNRHASGNPQEECAVFQYEATVGRKGEERVRQKSIIHDCDRQCPFQSRYDPTSRELHMCLLIVPRANACNTSRILDLYPW